MKLNWINEMSRALQGLYFLPYMALLSGFHWLTAGSLASNPRQCCSWQSPVKIHSNTWRAVISQINHLDKFHCTLPCVIDNLQRREELGQLCETKVVQPNIRWKCEPQQFSLIKLQQVEKQPGSGSNQRGEGGKWTILGPKLFLMTREFWEGGCHTEGGK